MSGEIRDRYRPNVGMLQPSAVLDIVIDPPIAPHEQAVVVSAGNFAVIMNEDPDCVRLRNARRQITPYLLLIVPRAMLKVAMHPWPEVIENITKELQGEHGVRALIRGIAAIVARSS